MCDAGNLEEAYKYLAAVEESGYKFGPKVWSCLVEKYSLGGNVDKAVLCFNEMFERSGREDPGSSFEVLVSGLCEKRGAKEGRIQSSEDPGVREGCGSLASYLQVFGTQVDPPRVCERIL
jgi:pentatricopeptide repeat protein